MTCTPEFYHGFRSLGRWRLSSDIRIVQLGQMSEESKGQSASSSSSIRGAPTPSELKRPAAPYSAQGGRDTAHTWYTTIDH